LAEEALEIQLLQIDFYAYLSSAFFTSHPEDFRAAIGSLIPGPDRANGGSDLLTKGKQSAQSSKIIYIDE